ncbi:hypothetical protein FBBAL38_05515 [Flavobacteria bacterium BAL38]|nr:hypothetical protein FBBAL38_05515 [Flavobacteria bacterium BAL38]
MMTCDLFFTKILFIKKIEVSEQKKDFKKYT